jgi:hypothetical protein
MYLFIFLVSAGVLVDVAVGVFRVVARDGIYNQAKKFIGLVLFVVRNNSWINVPFGWMASSRARVNWPIICWPEKGNDKNVMLFSSGWKKVGN